jgi:hypothetical protein
MKKSIEYRLKGTRRKVGAIGKMQPFTVYVSHQIDKITPAQAMDTARRSMYQDGFEHILFKSCSVRIDKQWKEIPMLEALGLE